MLRTTLVAILVLAGPAFAGEAAACHAARDLIDERNGFRDAKLGTPVDRMIGLKPSAVDSAKDPELFRHSSVRAFTRPTDDLLIFGQRLVEIKYFFFEDRLVLIDLRWWRNGSDGSRILEGFERALGCQATRKGSDIQLEVTGQRVWFFAIASTDAWMGSFGRVAFQDIAATKKLRETVKADALKEF